MTSDQIATGPSKTHSIWQGFAKESDIAPVVALLLLSACAFNHLMAVPAFEDEGTQLRLIWRVIEAGEWLQPLGEGKPLEAWPMVPVVLWAPNPLMAIRALHVLCGMLGTVLIYRLAEQIAGRRIALVGGVLFAVCPFVVYLERFAHSDILMCTAGIWVLLGVIRFAKQPTWGRAITLAVALVISALCKLPVGFVFLASMPLALLLMPARDRGVLLCRPVLLRLLVAHAPAVVLALAVIVIAMIRMHRGLEPGFGVQDFVGIGIGHYSGIAQVIGTRPTLMGELTTQLSWPVVVIGMIGLAASASLGDWRERWLLVMGLAPMLAIAWLATFWFSRYLLFALPPLIVAASSGWQKLSSLAPTYSRFIGPSVLALCIGFMVPQSARLVVDPITARWSRVDRFQYFESYVSGYGYPEAAQFLLKASAAPPTIYALDGHSAYQLREYLPAAWGARVEYIYYDDGRILRSEESRLANLLDHTPAWIVIADRLLQRYMDVTFGSDGAARLNLREVARFPKPLAREHLMIYEVTRR